MEIAGIRINAKIWSGSQDRIKSVVFPYEGISRDAPRGVPVTRQNSDDDFSSEAIKCKKRFNKFSKYKQKKYLGVKVPKYLE
jgi:hypothetical protein